MGILVDGQWRTDEWKRSDEGRFVRDESVFRSWVMADDGASGFPAERGRYHLYVSHACPWAHRTVIVRKLKKLEGVISLSAVDSLMLEDGWRFGGDGDPDPNGHRLLREIYLAAKPDCTGRVTVPVLWDRKHRTIVNNESSEIIRMLDREFDAFTDVRIDLYPDELREPIDAINARVYENVNNGVYRCGFATSQEAYEEALGALFATLDELEDRLSRQRYLVGERLTEADWRLFPTLVRFDAVYYAHFKCNLRRLVDYPQLWAYTRELYQLGAIAETVRLDHIKRHYYGSHRSINPTGIVPLGPAIDWREPHGRA